MIDLKRRGMFLSSYVRMVPVHFFCVFVCRHMRFACVHLGGRKHLFGFHCGVAK